MKGSVGQQQEVCIEASVRVGLICSGNNKKPSIAGLVSTRRE